MRQTSQNASATRKVLTSVALIGSLFGLAACGGGGGGEDAAAPPASEGAQAAPEDAQPEMPEPDLEGIPDVVATVDGEEISGEEFTSAYEAQFQQLAMQAQMSGQEMDQAAMKKQLAESMVGTELLVQDAEAQGHSASDEDVDAFLTETAEASGLADLNELYSTFEEQGYPKEQVRADAEKQVVLDASIAEMDIPKPSEEELKELYESSIAAQEQSQQGAEGSGGEGAEGGEAETPSFEELKPQLEQQLSSQKENEALTQRMEELRKDAEVEIKL